MKTVSKILDILKNDSEEITLRLNDSTGKIEVVLSKDDKNLKEALEKTFDDEVHGFESEATYE